MSIDWYAGRERATGVQDRLTRSQRLVLLLVAAGAQYPETARILGIALSTAKVYMRIAMDKLDAQTAAQTVANAMRRGWLTPADLDEGAKLRGLL